MHPNEELLRREYEAFAGNDIDALARIFSDDVVYHIGGDGPLSGDHRGRAAVFRLFDVDRDAAFTSEIHECSRTTDMRLPLRMSMAGVQIEPSTTSRCT